MPFCIYDLSLFFLPISLSPSIVLIPFPFLPYPHLFLSSLAQRHLDRYFFLLAALMIFNFVLFVLMARGYQYRNPSTQERGAAVEEDEVVPHSSMKARDREASLSAEVGQGGGCWCLSFLHFA